MSPCSVRYPFEALTEELMCSECFSFLHDRALGEVAGSVMEAFRRVPTKASKQDWSLHATRGSSIRHGLSPTPPATYSLNRNRMMTLLRYGNGKVYKISPRRDLTSHHRIQTKYNNNIDSHSTNRTIDKSTLFAQ
jgi:hypothetical protein